MPNFHNTGNHAILLHSEVKVMATIKTNAMRILDKAKLSYEVETYPHENEAIDGVQVAKLLNKDPQMVFKTLVTISNTKEYYVFLVPVQHELDLKKCAQLVGRKKLDMIHVKDIQKVSGYIRGGCSPIGMKKQFHTTLHNSCLSLDNIMFSGGKIGVQIILSVSSLIDLIHAEVGDIIKGEHSI